MSVLRISTSRWVLKESLKCFTQSSQLTTNLSRSTCCKYISSYASNNQLLKSNLTPLIEHNKLHIRHLSALSEPDSVSANSAKDSESYRNDHNITVVGDDIPDPIQTIDGQTFPDYILKYLKREKIDKPTVIQAQGWPIAIAGKNLVGIAQTGTGKTLAYLLPAVMHIKQKNDRKGSSPVALVLAPTRELARQIQQVADKLSKTLGIRTACVYGGASRNVQAAELERGVDLLIATPGRLNDFLNSKIINLDRCSYLVLDEADRMLDMGFEPQIRQIADMIPLDRQILMWSATWPKEVQSLAKDYLGEYIQVNVGSTDLSANHNIKQVVHFCEENEKNEKMQEILNEVVNAESGKILIFTNMKRTVEDVAHKLRIMGWPAVGIHGNKTQAQRDSIIYQFKYGRAKILVASDVAARGLDVENVSHVINYDYPTNSEDYIHRIGRTGRSGAKGTAHSLLTPDNARQAKELIAIIVEAGQDVPIELLELSKQQHQEKPNYKQNNRFTSWSSTGNRFGSNRGGYNNNNSRGDYNNNNRGGYNNSRGGYNNSRGGRAQNRRNKFDDDY